MEIISSCSPNDNGLIPNYFPAINSVFPQQVRVSLANFTCSNECLGGIFKGYCFIKGVLTHVFKHVCFD